MEDQAGNRENADGLKAEKILTWRMNPKQLIAIHTGQTCSEPDWRVAPKK